MSPHPVEKSPTAEPDPPAAIARLPRNTTDLTSPARFSWEPEQVEAIKQTVARECSPAEFVMFLELAARYGLDPFARQIWAAKMGDGQPVAILVGRDGLLSIAERYDEFDGMDSDVVVEGDKLTRDRDTREFVHEWGEQHLTGKVIGAWAQVWRSDRARPIGFYSRFAEYNKENSKFWKRHPSAMILKVAQSTALRLAFSITGLLVEEEVGGPEPASLTRASVIEWGDDPALADYLQTLVDNANEVRRNAYRPQKVLALLRGRSTADRRVFAQELVDFISSRGGVAPQPPDGLAALDGQRLRWDDEEALVIDGEVPVEEPDEPAREEEPVEPLEPTPTPDPAPNEPFEPTLPPPEEGEAA